MPGIARPPPAPTPGIKAVRNNGHMHCTCTCTYVTGTIICAHINHHALTLTTRHIEKKFPPTRSARAERGGGSVLTNVSG